jgi:arginine:pyruvate transaminase
MRVAYRERAQVLVEAINGSTAVSARMPEGGMFVMVDVRATKLSGEEFAWKLLDDHNIGVMPGESFGKGGAGHVRIALTVEAQVLRQACETIRTMAEALVAKAK